MKTLTIDDFTIDIHDGELGVFVSGGADSALLLYILMQNVEAPLHIFSCANGRSNFREPINALKIVNQVISMTGKKNLRFYTHWTDFKTTDTVILPETINMVDMSVVYFGLTCPPPEGAIVDYAQTNVAAVGGVDHGGNMPTFYQSCNRPPWYQLDKKNEELPDPGYTKSYYLPFVNINKQKVASLYRTLGIEDLYSLTRSCESTIINDRHCGNCWWCKERIWGFGYLD